MSTKYQNLSEVPTEALAKRLVELSDIVSVKRELLPGELTMSIPAEMDRDCDLHGR
jgi:hypothetical protein